MATYRIKDMEKNERPRERLQRLGPQALRTEELLAILLRVGMPGESAIDMGRRLLHDFHGLRGIHRAGYPALKQARGIGPAKASQILAAIELGRRLAQSAAPQRPAIHAPADAADLVMYEMSALPQEHLRVIALNTRNQVLEILEIYKGSVNSAQVRIGEIFKGLIQHDATGFILVHNHPSGDPTPSPDDVALTRSVREAGKLLDIELLDHLVIGAGRFVSLKERKLGF